MCSRMLTHSIQITIEIPTQVVDDPFGWIYSQTWAGRRSVIYIQFVNWVRTMVTRCGRIRHSIRKNGSNSRIRVKQIVLECGRWLRVTGGCLLSMAQLGSARSPFIEGLSPYLRLSVSVTQPKSWMNLSFEGKSKSGVKNYYSLRCPDFLSHSRYSLRDRE